MAGYTLLKRNKTALKGRQKQNKARNYVRPEAVQYLSSGIPKSIDPVYALTNEFTKRFDALGMFYSGKMGNATQADKISDGNENPGSGDSIADKHKTHESPEYVHSRHELNECQFAERFSSYAFRGGKLAAAVMAGQGKQMFTLCLSRALGRTYHGAERQKKVMGESAAERAVGGMSSSVRFNRDAQSAVSIVTDTTRGSSRLLELFTRLASDSGQQPEHPLEMNDVDTLQIAFPFLRTEDDKASINRCRARLKELENCGDTASRQTSRLLRSALVKQTAVLRRKEEQKRCFLTKLNEISRNVREAEKLFSSDGFAEQALDDAAELMEDIPPDDGRRRKAAFDVASAVADFISGLGGEEHGALQQSEPQREDTPQREETGR